MIRNSVLLVFIFLSCNRFSNRNTEKNNVMKGNMENKDSVSYILNQLNDWARKYYNKDTKEIESTGEVQAMIKNHLSKLDKMKVKYKFEDGKYILIKE
ncbi:MAG: hypothetical protein ACRCVT_14680 [Leadbetterella sp.]